MKISICGKGGSGKSTVVTLLAKAVREKDLSVLVVDSDVFLLSVLRSEASAETAIWSSHTSFAEVFSQLLLQPKSG